MNIEPTRRENAPCPSGSETGNSKDGANTSIQSQLLSRYHEVHGAHLTPREEWKDRQRVFDALARNSLTGRIPSTGRLLDVGCGKGFLLGALSKIGDYEVYGVDANPGEVAVAREILLNVPGGARLAVEDANDYLARERGRFDCVVCKAVLEHIPKDNVSVFLKRIHDALKPGGTAIMMVPNMDWIAASHERYMDFTHETGFTQESLGQVMRLYFDRVETFPVDTTVAGGIVSYVRNRVVRPLAVAVFRRVYAMVSGGFQNSTLEYRSIGAVGTTKSSVS